MKRKKRKLWLDFDESDEEDSFPDEIKSEIGSYRQEPALGKDGVILFWMERKEDEVP